MQNEEKALRAVSCYENWKNLVTLNSVFEIEKVLLGTGGLKIEDIATVVMALLT